MLFLIINSTIVDFSENYNSLEYELGLVLVDGGVLLDDNLKPVLMDDNEELFVCNSSIVDILKEGDTVDIFDTESNKVLKIGISEVSMDDLTDL